MATAIATAFVKIIARLELESNNELEQGLRATVKRMERDLDRLEGAAKRAGAQISKQLSSVEVDLNVREALRDIDRVREATEGVSSELHALRGQGIALDTDRANKDINTLGTRVQKLLKDVKLVDGSDIDFNVEDAARHLNVLDAAIDRLLSELRGLDGGNVNLDVQTAVNDLERLERAVNSAITDIGRLDEKRIRINVDDVDLDILQRKIDRLDAERVTIPVETTGAEVARAQIERVQNQAGDFSRAFRRILAFGAIREVSQVVGQLFTAGVRAAGAIQLVEVSLNRFFAQTKDLGQTAGQFFNELRNLAIETPFEFKDLAETSRRILAMGTNADDTISIMTDLSDAVAAVGGGQGEIDGVVRALSQLSSKGKVDLQDFRQISENLPSLSRQLQIKGVIDELNELHPGLNATRADFEDLRQSGLITGEVLRDGVVRAIREIPGVVGAAKAAARTLQGALSNLADFATQEFSRAFSGLGGIIADELNAAFGSVNGDALTPLASAMRDIISAFGRAGESNLPGIFEGIADTAPEVSALVRSISDLVQEALPALSNLGEGALRSVTGLAALAESALSIFSALPDGMQEAIGGFVTLAAVIPGAGESMRKGLAGVVTSFVAVRVASAAATAAVATGASASKIQMAALEVATKKAALAAFTLQVAITAGLIVAVQLITSRMATAKRRADEFSDSIDTAAESLGEFETFGEGVLDFLNKFRIEGEGINIGGLEKFLDGMTTGELEESLGATTDQLATLVGELSRAGDVSDREFSAALEAAGLSMDDMSEAGAGAKANIQALADQLAQATERAFDAALASQEFVFAIGEQDAIKRAAEHTGDYAKGLEDLEAANQRGAKAEIIAAKSRGASQSQIDKAIAANTTYKAGLNGTIEATIDYAGALQDLAEELQRQDTLFEGLGERFRGFNDTFDNLIGLTNQTDLGQSFTEFALAIDKAGLSAEELNAIANNFGDTLGLVLSGDELGKIVTAFVSRVGELKGAFESVLPGIEDLQFEADSFSLDAFLDELDRIANARDDVVGNMQKIIDAFGNFGREAITALAEAGLTPEQFALAIEEVLAEGPAAISKILLGFSAALTPELETLVNDLVGAGLSEEKVNEILGVDAFESGVGRISASVTAAEEVLSKLGTLGDAVGALFGLGAVVPQVPELDVEKAVTDADAAGEEVGVAFTSSLADSMAGATETLDDILVNLHTFGVDAVASLAEVGAQLVEDFENGFESLSEVVDDELTDVTLRIGQFGNRLRQSGFAAGKHMTVGFGESLELASRTAKEISKVSSTLNSPAFKAAALAAGFQTGFNFGRGVAVGINATIGLAVVAALRLVSSAFEAARAAARISSPSKLFAGLGEEIGAGVAAGITSTLPAIQRASSGMIVAAGTGAGIRLDGSSFLPGTTAQASALGKLSLGAATPGRGNTVTSAAVVGTGEVHHHYHITAPTDDPEAMALRVASRLERRLEG